MALTVLGSGGVEAGGGIQKRDVIGPGIASTFPAGRSDPVCARSADKIDLVSSDYITRKSGGQKERKRGKASRVFGGFGNGFSNVEDSLVAVEAN